MLSRDYSAPNSALRLHTQSNTLPPQKLSQATNLLGTIDQPCPKYTIKYLIYIRNFSTKLRKNPLELKVALVLLQQVTPAIHSGIFYACVSK